MSKPLFLQAFDGTNSRPPIWFMRQAGRFLPEYRALRQKHSLNEMFAQPELAAEITCQPVRILSVDAAILFADILTLPAHSGFDVHFDNQLGPVISNLITHPEDVQRIAPLEDVPHIRKTIQMIKEQLGKETPLIGFAGGPFTVLSYLIEGGSSISFQKMLAFYHQHSDEFADAMQKITDNTIAYLKIQKNAGIDAFQIFDTWAGILPPADYERNILPYIQQIFAAIDLPSIYYLKNSKPFLPWMSQSGADFLSVCQTVDLEKESFLTQVSQGIQGNFWNALFYADYSTLDREVSRLLQASKKFRRYIFNLNHGILPDTDVDKVRFVIEKIKKEGIRRG
ncbi:MAG: uroporphyrinogen decarboxylase [Candidatus Omnitrophica bacterium]|nr:uroporphyrinogen decarboxylase [Candidatus Omnitrophota bacterium]